MSEDKNNSHESTYSRLVAYMNHLGIGTSEFMEMIGTTMTTLKNIGPSSPRNLYYKIYARFPQLSPRWLQYGEGEMLRTVAMAQTSKADILNNFNNTKEDDYIVIQADGIRTLFNKIINPQNIMERYIEHYGAIIAQKDEQIAKLMASLDAKDRLIAQLAQKQ